MALGWRLRLFLAATVLSAISALWFSFQGTSEHIFIQTLPHSLGIRVQGGDVHVLLQRGTQLPATASWMFTTTEHNQKRAQVHLFAGEGPSSIDRWLLASLSMEPLPEMSFLGHLQLEVTVRVETWNLVTLSAVEAEGKALGQESVETEWAGTLSDSQEEVDFVVMDKDEIQAKNHSEVRLQPILRLQDCHVQLAGGRTIVIEQEAWGLAGTWETGGVLWDSAVVLADFVITQKKALAWPGKRVLELGAGTGLVSIALAKEKSLVLATQSQTRCCDMFSSNVEKNMDSTDIVSTGIRCDILRWSSHVDVDRIAKQGPWDVIVGSDLLFPENADVSSAVLLQMLTTLASNHTQVVMTLQERNGVIERFVARVRQTDWVVNFTQAESSLSVEARNYLKRNGSNSSGHQRSQIQIMHLKRPTVADSQAPRPSQTTLAASR